MPLRSDPPIRLGIVGLGRAAVSFLPSLETHRGVEIVAAADPSDRKRRAFEKDFHVPTYVSADELCIDRAVDAIYVATPHQYHAEHVVLAAAHGKHCLVEKPIALTLDDGRRMLAAAASARIVLVVGPTHGFDPPVRLAAQMVASGEFGALRLVNTLNYTDFLYRPRRSEELDTQQGGGVIFNQLPHQVDMIRTIAGGRCPTSVAAAAGVWDPNRRTEGSCVGLLRFDDGLVATLVYSGYAHFDSDELCDWVGEDGRRKDPEVYGAARRLLSTVRSPGAEALLKEDTGYGGGHQLGKSADAVGIDAATDVLADRFMPQFGLLIAGCERADLMLTPRGVRIYGDDRRWEEQLASSYASSKHAVIDEFCDAVRLGTLPTHNGNFGMTTLACCLAMLRSSRERWEVPLDEAQLASS